MFENVTIIGTGLLGGSLARDLKHYGLAKHIVGVCRSESTAKAALSAAVVDQVLPAAEAVKNADLIVLATPMQTMVPLLHSLRDEIPKSAIITDVGSVKTDLYAQLKQKVPSLLNQFVLAHPIAGGENSGVAASKLGLFQNKHVIITDTDEAPDEATLLVATMWSTIGAKVMRMSLKEHDATFAKTSHLPHVIAFSLVNFLSHQSDRGRLFDLAAAGFYDFTRIASSDAEMWRDICITNRQEVLTALDGFRDQIDVIREQVEASDQTAILNYFGEAKSARDAGLLNKAESMKKKQQ
ncbi:MAG: prephenate dehydrogenase [Arenicella sp.]|jgi:prephenate dehydrogenase